MTISSCVLPEGRFRCGTHRPRFQVKNLRPGNQRSVIGRLPDGRPVVNGDNFPEEDIDVNRADRVYEIPNPFPFKGVTYISGYFADRVAENPESIGLPEAEPLSMARTLSRWTGGAESELRRFYRLLPRPMRLALAVTSTDAAELTELASLTCRFTTDSSTGLPDGLAYTASTDGKPRPDIRDHDLFEALANNPHLPEPHRRAMVLIPGAQGVNEITAEWQSADGKSHIYEYFRRNSYIPWGHFAANMAEDAIRYRVSDLTPMDMTGLRHLYCQRTYVRLARMLGLPLPATGTSLNETALETLRTAVRREMANRGTGASLPFTGTLWGWNFGFGFTPEGYRMHGSHQQIHQQYALIPATVSTDSAAGGPTEFPAYACGDLVAAFTRAYREKTGRPFFSAYLEAIARHERIDGNRYRDASLTVWEDDNVLVFVPIAQTSQWELQVMAKKPVGNILEADPAMRRSLNRGILTAVKALDGLGARMITGIEIAKRLDSPDEDQRLIYDFLPRLPQSPGAFSEAQLRWVNRHYPEDFAAVCRSRLARGITG